MVKGARKLAQLVRQGAIRRRSGKFAALNAFAGLHQVIQRQHHLTTDASQGKQRQQQDPECASQREQGDRLNFMFGVVLEGEHKGINAAHKILNIALVPRAVAAGDMRIHLLPGHMQLLIACFHIVRDVPAVQLLQGRRAERLLPALAMCLKERAVALHLVAQTIALHAQ